MVGLSDPEGPFQATGFHQWRWLSAVGAARAASDAVQGQTHEEVGFIAQL